MKYIRTIIAISVLVLSVACSDEEILERREDRITGTWYFDKAFYKRDNVLFRSNILSDYSGDYITFYPEYQALYDDHSLNAIFDGSWNLYLDRYDDGEKVFNLEMIFYDDINGTEFSYYGELTHFTRNNITLEVHDGRGLYIFKLSKLD